MIYGVDVALQAANFWFFYLIGTSPLTTELLVSKLRLTPDKELALRKVYNNFLVEIYMGLSWDVKWHKDKHIYSARPPPRGGRSL